MDGRETTDRESRHAGRDGDLTQEADENDERRASDRIDYRLHERRDSLTQQHSDEDTRQPYDEDYEYDGDIEWDGPAGYNMIDRVPQPRRRSGHHTAMGHVRNPMPGPSGNGQAVSRVT